jgi:hypothetical protein
MELASLRLQLANAGLVPLPAMGPDFNA